MKRYRAWKVHCTKGTFAEADAVRSELLSSDEPIYLKEHTLCPSDKPVKVKRRPRGVFDVKVLVVDKEKEEE
jgi:hypothetical protein